jgi:5-methylcytosine-specific restriction endonuclease McrA
MTNQRHTTRRNRFRRILAKDGAPCHLCGGAIDYEIDDHLSPLAFQADHVIPLSKGGRDVLENLAPSHRGCNQRRYNKPLPDQVLMQEPQPAPPKQGVTYVTRRDWSSNLNKGASIKVLPRTTAPRTGT